MFCVGSRPKKRTQHTTKNFVGLLIATIAVYLTIFQETFSKSIFPVFSHATRKELWDRQGGIASRCRKCMAKSCFHVKKKKKLESDQHFFAVRLSQMDLRNVDMKN